MCSQPFSGWSANPYMSIKSSIPYIVPEAVSAEATSVLADIPASEPVILVAPAPEAPASPDPLTPEQERTLAFAKMVVAYNSLFAACKRLISRARPANRLKHNYFVCAADLEAIASEMDGEIAGLLDKAMGERGEDKA